MSNGSISQSRRILERARKIVKYIDKKMECKQSETVDILRIHRFTLSQGDCSYLIRNEADLTDKVYSLLEEKGYKLSLYDNSFNSEDCIDIKPSKFRITINKE